jgi:hypothetical protein
MLKQLADIIAEELRGDETLLNLCQRDSRLGFHSEAEGYKYYPEKIRWRVQQLRTVLAADVPAVETLIREGKPLFPEYTGREPGGALAYATRSDDSIWSSHDLVLPPAAQWQSCTYGAETPALRWAATYDAKALYVIISGTKAAAESAATPFSSVLVKIEPRRLWPCKHFVFMPGAAQRAEVPDQVAPQTADGRFVAVPGEWRAVVRIPLVSIGLSAEQLHPLRLDVRVQRNPRGTVAWRPSNPATPRLALGTDNPADLGWLLFRP